LIETWGLVPAVEAVDAGCKAANVRLVGYEEVRAGLVTILLEGDVAAIRAAVAAGSAAARRVGMVASVHVISRPDRQLDGILPGPAAPRSSPTGDSGGPPPPSPPEPAAERASEGPESPSAPKGGEPAGAQSLPESPVKESSRESPEMEPSSEIPKAETPVEAPEEKRPAEPSAESRNEVREGPAEELKTPADKRAKARTRKSSTTGMNSGKKK